LKEKETVKGRRKNSKNPKGSEEVVCVGKERLENYA